MITSLIKYSSVVEHWMEHFPQGSGHSTVTERVQEGFEQHPEAHGVTLGVSCTGPGVGLDIFYRSLPTQHILRSYDFP